MTEEATEAVEIPTQLPIVDYLRIGDDPHLAANECVGCEARYFDRRNACAKCGKEEFRSVRVADDATSVRANVVGLDNPMKAELGMRLRFTTFSCGTDDNGTDCVAFGYAAA